MKLILSFIILLITTLTFAQNKIDSIPPPSIIHKLNVEQKSITIEKDIKELPIQYLQMYNTIKLTDPNWARENKIFLYEIIENYRFSAEELNSGLSEDELISYSKNKKRTKEILAETYSERANVNWEKIERILGISQHALAFILALFHLIKNN